MIHYSEAIGETRTLYVQGGFHVSGIQKAAVSNGVVSLDIVTCSGDMCSMLNGIRMRARGVVCSFTDLCVSILACPSAPIFVHLHSHMLGITVDLNTSSVDMGKN